jgi:hypothetical protein
MQNGKQELLDIGIENILCAEIKVFNEYACEITDNEVACYDTYEIKIGQTNIDSLINRINQDYEPMSGCHEEFIFGTIWMKDGTWYSRDSRKDYYATYESWKLYKLPEIPNNLK